MAGLRRLPNLCGAQHFPCLRISPNLPAKRKAIRMSSYEYTVIPAPVRGEKTLTAALRFFYQRLDDQH